MSRPQPPFPFAGWDEFAAQVDAILDSMYKPGEPLTHSASCVDHDHCLTSAILRHFWQEHDPVLCDIVRPLVEHWSARHQAERN